MDRPTPAPRRARWVSTTMSRRRSFNERWVNGFKLMFFAGFLFTLVGFPFSVVEYFLEEATRETHWKSYCAVWVVYGAVAFLVYPILFDWVAGKFRIQFVHKSISRPAAPLGLGPVTPPPDAPSPSAQPPA